MLACPATLAINSVSQHRLVLSRYQCVHIIRGGVITYGVIFMPNNTCTDVDCHVHFPRPRLHKFILASSRSPITKSAAISALGGEAYFTNEILHHQEVSRI